MQLYSGSVLIAPIGGTLLGVRATHNTETTFSTFSRDLSRCLNLSHIVPESHSEPQKYQRGYVSPPHSPYIDMPRSLPLENWLWHLSLTYELFAQFPPNKLPFFETTWQILCAPIGVVPRKNGILYFM